MFYRFATTIIVALGLILALGCSQGDNDTVAPLTTLSNQAVNQTTHQVWGLYDCNIDPDTGEISTIPLRTAEFNANVVRFLQPPVAPIELVQMEMNIAETDIADGLIAIDITVRHPFPGSTRFRGFDVRGIIMTRGTNYGKYDDSVIYRGPGEAELLNPDGYTRWWNQVEFTTYNTILGYTDGHYANPGFISTTTVNPYKLHTPHLEPVQPIYQLDLDTRATFPAIDGVSRRRYRLQFDMTQMPPFAFKYAIDASWSQPDPAYDPDYPVEAYDEMANCQEPYLVRIEEYEEIPYYVDEWVSGGNLQFLLTIGDWQATDGSNVIDQISHVWLESTTLFEDPIDVRDEMEFVSSDHPTQATYRIGPLDDMLPDGLFDQIMIVTVESATPDSYEPQIEGDTSMFAYPDEPLAAYTIVDVPITNLTPQGEYAYVYFLPDWCATMRYQCTQDQSGTPYTSGNQPLMANIISQNLDGYYNDFTKVQCWEGKTNTSNQNSDALHDTVTGLGYTFERTYNDYFDPTDSRAVIVVLLNTSGQGPNPPFTHDEAVAMQEFIENGGILFFMCEASGYFNASGVTELMDWLGMLMAYGGGAEPEYSDGFTDNIIWHWLTEDVPFYHYYTCGTWISEDPHVLELVATETDQKLVIMYPLPLE